MVGDFAYLIDTYGHIPNGTRSYYLSRSQPPFFFAMVGLLDTRDPSAAYARYLPQLRREHAFWMQGEKGLRRGTAHRRVVALGDGSIVNRYWDDADTPREESFREDTELARSSGRIPRQLYRDLRAAAESGWDFSSRWFADGRNLAAIDTTEIVPVDLNSLLFGLETAIRSGCERAADAPCAAEFTRRAACQADCRESLSVECRRRRLFGLSLHPAATRAAHFRSDALSLFVALADERQARAVARAISRDLLKAGGIVTTPVASGQQWDAPNGWPPLQWVGISGLRRYSNSTAGGHHRLPMDVERQAGVR